MARARFVQRHFNGDSAAIAKVSSKAKTATKPKVAVEHDDFDWHWVSAEWQVRLDELDRAIAEEKMLHEARQASENAADKADVPDQDPSR